MHLLFSHMTFSPSTALCFHVMPMSCTAAASTPKLFPCESFMRDLEHFHSSHCSCATPKGIIFYCPDPGSAFLLTITRAVCKGRGSEGMAFLCPPPSPPLFFILCAHQFTGSCSCVSRVTSCHCALFWTPELLIVDVKAWNVCRTRRQLWRVK